MSDPDAIPAELPIDPLLNVPKPRRSPILQAGGFLGIAGCLIGLGVLVTSCAGFEKALIAGAVVIGLGVLGLLVTLLGALTQKKRIEEESHVLAAFFVNGIAILGGLLQYAVSQGWTLGGVK